MVLRFVSDYKQETPLRLSFNSLAKRVFGIDFEQWYQQGSWDDRYVCYSFADKGQIVANVSVTKMKLLLEGSIHPALQIGTVMTDPAYRKQAVQKAAGDSACPA
jgi:hypothetical protein